MVHMQDWITLILFNVARKLLFKYIYMVVTSGAMLYPSSWKERIRQLILMWIHFQRNVEDPQVNTNIVFISWLAAEVYYF